MADVFAPQPVKTKSNGDVVAKLVDSAGSNVGAITSSGALKVDLTATTANSTAVKVDGSAVTQPVSGTVTVQQATASNLKVDLSGTAANSTAIKVDGSAVTQPVSFGITGTTQTDYTTSASLAAGATVNIDSTNVPSGTGHLVSVLVGASVACRWRIGTWDGTTFTVKAVVWTPANASFLYEPARNDSITKATGATAKFRVEALNNDNANAADVYVTTEYYY